MFKKLVSTILIMAILLQCSALTVFADSEIVEILDIEAATVATSTDLPAPVEKTEDVKEPEEKIETPTEEPAEEPAEAPEEEKTEAPIETPVEEKAEVPTEEKTET
ncbi:MAG: hypothetical protein MJ150_04485, partial [Clostridia bacterium]|nr:hypothetical protein [Clostridia bacterium]